MHSRCGNDGFTVAINQAGLRQAHGAPLACDAGVDCKASKRDGTLQVDGQTRQALSGQQLFKGSCKQAGGWSCMTGVFIPGATGVRCWLKPDIVRAGEEAVAHIF